MDYDHWIQDGAVLARILQVIQHSIIHHLMIKHIR